MPVIGLRSNGHIQTFPNVISNINLEYKRSDINPTIEI